MSSAEGEAVGGPGKSAEGPVEERVEAPVSREAEVVALEAPGASVGVPRSLASADGEWQFALESYG